MRCRRRRQLLLYIPRYSELVENASLETQSIHLYKTKYKLTALLIFAFRNVLPHAFRFGTLGCYGACGVFVVGTLSGVEEKDEVFLMLLH